MTDDSQPLDLRVLHAIFHLSQATAAIDATAIARQTGLSPSAAATACLALESDGLVDATRARLTMLGLARACATGAGQGGLSRPVERRRAVPSTAARPDVEPALPPLAAQPARAPLAADADPCARPLAAGAAGGPGSAESPQPSRSA